MGLREEKKRVQDVQVCNSVLEIVVCSSRNFANSNSSMKEELQSSEN